MTTLLNPIDPPVLHKYGDEERDALVRAEARSEASAVHDAAVEAALRMAEEASVAEAAFGDAVEEAPVASTEPPPADSGSDAEVEIEPED